MEYKMRDLCSDTGIQISRVTIVPLFAFYRLWQDTDRYVYHQPNHAPYSQTLNSRPNISTLVTKAWSKAGQDSFYTHSIHSIIFLSWHCQTVKRVHYRHLFLFFVCLFVFVTITSCFHRFVGLPKLEVNFPFLKLSEILFILKLLLSFL